VPLADGRNYPEIALRFEENCIVKKLQLAMFLSMTLILLNGCNSKNNITETDAQQIAAGKLREYAELNKIPLDQLGNPEIRFNREMELWEFYYQSTGKPKHLVNIMVDKSGGAKINFLVE
jgi:hypothetical protein